MKCLISHGALGLLLLLGWLPSASAQLSTQIRVAGIVITNVGPQAAGEDFIRANIRVKVGDAFADIIALRQRYDQDLRTLYETGLFSPGLQVVEQFSSDGVILHYVLPGRYRLTGVTFEGSTEYSTSKLMKAVTSKSGDPLDERKLFDDVLAIEKLYEKDGYTQTRVRYDLVNIDQVSGRAGVTFEITEAPKIKVEDVIFPGAHAFEEKKLRKVIKTGRSWYTWPWFTGTRKYKEDQILEDREKLRDFYFDNGFIDFDIVEMQTNYPTSNTMILKFIINEGNPYKVGAVTFKGNKLFTSEQLAEGLKDQHAYLRSRAVIGEHGLEADTGLLFRPDALRRDMQSIENFYGSKGYIGLREGPNYLRVSRVPNVQAGTMDVEYLIDEGEKYYIEKIEIRGNIKTKDKVLRRELAVAPGEVFDLVGMHLSEQRLNGLDYFEKVEMSPENDPSLALPNRKNLIVAVEEKSTGSLTFGAGFNTIESISAIVQMEQRNFDLFNPPYFTGAGQKFRLTLQLGTQLQNYQAEFVEPWFLDRKLSLGVAAYHSEYDYQSQDNLYNEARTGLRTSLTRALGSDFLIGSVSYTLEQVNIFHVNTNAPNAILDDAGRALVSRIGGSLAYDTRNEVKLPTKGQRTSISSIVTVGDRNYLNMEASTGWYFGGGPMKGVLEVVARGGVAQKLGTQDVPFYDKYYLGGLRDLRGYDYRGVGPREVTQDGNHYEPIGGNTFWMGSLEYSIPLMDNVRLAVFYDIGNVSEKPWSNAPFNVLGKMNEGIPGPPPGFTTFSAGNTGDYSDNYGLGLHLDIPHLGPLRLDYGIPLHHDVFNGSSGRFQFGVGFTRPL
jgi:outer membrane protein insertion porin family